MRILAAMAFLGWGERITAGSEVIVRASLDSRDWSDRRLGRWVELRRIVAGEIGGAGAGTALMGGALPRESDFRGSSGGVSSGVVSGDRGDRVERGDGGDRGVRGFGVDSCCLSVNRYSGVGSRLEYCSCGTSS